MFANGGRARTMDFEPETSAMFRRPHYVQNTGDTDLKFLEMFKCSAYQRPGLIGMANPHAARSRYRSPWY